MRISCLLLPSEIGDEFHYLLKCNHPSLSHIRGIFLESLYSINSNFTNMPCKAIFLYIMSMCDENIINFLNTRGLLTGLTVIYCNVRWVMWVRVVGYKFFLSFSLSAPGWDKNDNGKWLYPSLLTSILNPRSTSPPPPLINNEPSLSHNP